MMIKNLAMLLAFANAIDVEGLLDSGSDIFDDAAAEGVKQACELVATTSLTTFDLSGLMSELNYDSSVKNGDDASVGSLEFNYCKKTCNGSDGTDCWFGEYTPTSKSSIIVADSFDYARGDITFAENMRDEDKTTIGI